MKFLQVLLILTLCLAVAACVTLGKSMNKVEYDYDVTTDFTDIKTYDWHPDAGYNKISQLDAVRIRTAVDYQLQTRGIENSSASPDFLIIVYGGARREYTTRWRGWDDELWYEQGRLKLVFFDTKSNKVFWWAETRADVFYNMEPEEKNQIVDDAVRRIMAKFPPDSSE